MASMLRENLNPDTTVIGLDIKVLAGMIYATVIADEPLAAEVRILGTKTGVSRAQLDEAVQFAQHTAPEPPGTDPKVNAALWVARAASPSPAAITAEEVALCRQSGLSPAAIVELTTWISVLQMLHRLSSYFVAA